MHGECHVDGCLARKDELQKALYVLLFPLLAYWTSVLGDESVGEYGRCLGKTTHRITRRVRQSVKVTFSANLRTISENGSLSSCSSVSLALVPARWWLKAHSDGASVRGRETARTERRLRRRLIL